MSVETYFDVRKYSNGANPTADLAALFGENTVAPERKRIVPYQIVISADGSVDMFDIGEGEDREIARRVCKMASGGLDSLVWVSPASESGGFGETRMVVYEVEDRGGGKVKFNCWGISTGHSQRECLEAASMMWSIYLGSDYRVSDGEVLRMEPVPIKTGEKWTEQMKLFWGRDEVWQAIESGEARRDHQERLVAAEMVASRYGRMLRQEMGQVAAWQVGAMMERDIAEVLGVRLQMVGSCGVSNEMMLASLVRGGGGSFFDRLFMASEVRVSEGSFDCPKCNGKIPSGRGIETCPHCGAKKSDYGSGCD